MYLLHEERINYKKKKLMVKLFYLQETFGELINTANEEIKDVKVVSEITIGVIIPTMLKIKAIKFVKEIKTNLIRGGLVEEWPIDGVLKEWQIDESKYLINNELNFYYNGKDTDVEGLTEIFMSFLAKAFPGYDMTFTCKK